jgi:hypothetical protein
MLALWLKLQWFKIIGHLYLLWYRLAKTEPVYTTPMYVQYMYATREGSIVTSILNDRLRGFTDIYAALAYIEADAYRAGKDGIGDKILWITDKEGHA